MQRTFFLELFYKNSSELEANECSDLGLSSLELCSQLQTLELQTTALIRPQLRAAYKTILLIMNLISFDDLYNNNIKYVKGIYVLV